MLGKEKLLALGYPTFGPYAAAAAVDAWQLSE